MKQRLTLGLAVLAALVGGLYALTVYRLAHRHSNFGTLYSEMEACTPAVNSLYDAYVMDERTEGFYMPVTYVALHEAGKSDPQLVSALVCVKKHLSLEVLWVSQPQGSDPDTQPPALGVLEEEPFRTSQTFTR